MATDAAPVGTLPDGTPYYAPFGELVSDDDTERVRCHLCGRLLRIIGGTHLRVTHGWTIDQYREVFELREHVPTCSHELSARWRESARTRRGRDGFGIPPAKAAGSHQAPRWRSLAHLYPELLDDLHSTRNGDLETSALAVGSHIKVWWRCPRCSHQWRATVYNRALRGSGCPVCGRKRRADQRKRVEPQRSLAATRPDLTLELHPALNGALDEHTVGIASTQKLWWRCRTCAHEWQATVANRSSGTGCPSCWQTRRSTVSGTVPPERSLTVRAPHLLQELHPTRNPSLNPATLGARSNRKVWWRCTTCGHEWQARIASRSTGDGCPQCFRARQRQIAPRPVPPECSLAARAPGLLAELHRSLNPALDPNTLGAGSTLRAWWRCQTCGHQWQTKISNRTRGSGCPACARERRQ